MKRVWSVLFSLFFVFYLHAMEFNFSGHQNETVKLSVSKIKQLMANVIDNLNVVKGNASLLYQNIGQQSIAQREQIKKIEQEKKVFLGGLHSAYFKGSVNEKKLKIIPLTYFGFYNYYIENMFNPYIYESRKNIASKDNMNQYITLIKKQIELGINILQLESSLSYLKNVAGRLMNRKTILTCDWNLIDCDILVINAIVQHITQKN